MPAALTPVFAYSPILEHMLSLTQGGGDGVIRNDGDEGAVTAEGTPSMSVDMGTFSGYVSNRIARLSIAETVGPITGPTGGGVGDLRRKDLVQWTLGEGVNIKTGVEDAAPAPPAADSDSLVLAHIYCRKDMAVIKDADDSSNGYIVDVRTYL